MPVSVVDMTLLWWMREALTDLEGGWSDRGLYHAPVIPAGIWWNLVESFLAGSPAKIAIPGTSYSGGIEPFRNWDRNGPGMDRNRIWRNAIK